MTAGGAAPGLPSGRPLPSGSPRRCLPPRRDAPFVAMAGERWAGETRSSSAGGIAHKGLPIPKLHLGRLPFFAVIVLVCGSRPVPDLEEVRVFVSQGVVQGPPLLIIRGSIGKEDHVVSGEIGIGHGVRTHGRHGCNGALELGEGGHTAIADLGRGDIAAQRNAQVVCHGVEDAVCLVPEGDELGVSAAGKGTGARATSKVAPRLRRGRGVFPGVHSRLPLKSFTATTHQVGMS